jgi:uncharacterized protein YggE
MGSRIRRGVSVLTLAAAFVFTARFFDAPAFAQGADPPSVVAMGEATVQRAPDRAWLSIAVETRDPRADQARQRGAQAMTDVQAALKATGLAADAIRTTGFSLMPDLEWNNGRSTMRGYIVRNQIDVRVDDLDKLGDVIDAANASKNGAITVTGPTFGLRDQQAAEIDALRQAVGAAMARAQAMAEGAHRTLGAVLRITDEQRPPTPPRPIAMMAQSGERSAPTPITPGEIEIHSQVTVTVELR